MILASALTFAIAAFAVALVLNLLRLFTARTVTDRILALDTMTVNIIALIVLGGVKPGFPVNYEAALLFALTGFISTVAFCKYLLR